MVWGTDVKYRMKFEYIIVQSWIYMQTNGDSIIYYSCCMIRLAPQKVPAWLTWSWVTKLLPVWHNYVYVQCTLRIERDMTNYRPTHHPLVRTFFACICIAPASAIQNLEVVHCSGSQSVYSCIIYIIYMQCLLCITLCWLQAKSERGYKPDLNCGAHKQL